MSRIYLVTGPGDTQRLVRAALPSSAIRHVTRQDYEARVPTQDELVAAAAKGIKVEEASEPQGAEVAQQ